MKCLLLFLLSTARAFSMTRSRFVMNSIRFVGASGLAVRGRIPALADDEPEETFASVSISEDKQKVYLYGGLNEQVCAIAGGALRTAAEACRDRKVPVHLHVQSNGGELMPSLYLSDMVANLGVPVHSFIDGYAASSATLVTVVAKRRFMSRHGSMLIHQLSSVTSGKLSEMEEEMTNLKHLTAIIRDIYLENTNIDSEELDKYLDRDLWLGLEKCAELGLVDGPSPNGKC